MISTLNNCDNQPNYLATRPLIQVSKGGDVRSGVVRCRAWAPGLCAWNLRGRRGTSGSPRGVMYALARSGVVLGLRDSVRGICMATNSLANAVCFSQELIQTMLMPFLLSFR